MKIGNLTLKSNALFAPVAGFSDVALRRLCYKYGAGLCYTEMVSAKGLMYKNKNTAFLLAAMPDEQPKAVQLFGNDPEVFFKVAKSEEIAPFDVIDINMGCPVPKIVSNGEGSALMENPPLIEEIVRAAKESGKAVSCKFRIGFNSPSVIECALSAEKGGADMITVHGRLRSDYYAGEANHLYCKQVKEAVNIPVVANGDIRTREDYLKVLEFTGADGVMIARGALGRPFVFSEILDIPFTVDIKSDILEQIAVAKKYYPEAVLVNIMKKHLCYWAKSARLPKKTNLVFTSLKSYGEMLKAVETYF